MGKEQAGKRLHNYQDYQNHDAFFRAQEIRDHWARREGWKEKQRERLAPSFKDRGNVHNAVEILYSLYEGASYVYGKVRKRGVTDLKLPDYTVKRFESMSDSEIIERLNLMAAGKLKTFIGYSKADNKFRIDEWDLQRASYFDLFKSFYTEDNQGNIDFVGTWRQFFRLAGVEAGYYAIFDTKKSADKTIYPVPNQPNPPIETESEYRALIWKLRYTQEKHYSTETINYLNIRREAIRAYRQGGHTT